MSYVRPLVPPWAVYLIAFCAIGAFVGGVVTFGVWADDRNRRECERKGGQYVRLYKSWLCAKKGSVIE